MIRRRLLPFIFSLLVVFAFQQAVVHPYAHTQDLLQSASADQKSPVHSDHCVKCDTLAAFAGAIGHKAIVVYVSQPLGIQKVHAIPQPATQVVHLPYSSRAPPYLA